MRHLNSLTCQTFFICFVLLAAGELLACPQQDGCNNDRHCIREPHSACDFRIARKSDEGARIQFAERAGSKVIAPPRTVRSPIPALTIVFPQTKAKPPLCPAGQIWCDALNPEGRCVIIDPVDPDDYPVSPETGVCCDVVTDDGICLLHDQAQNPITNNEGLGSPSQGTRLEQPVNRSAPRAPRDTYAEQMHRLQSQPGSGFANGYQPLGTTRPGSQSGQGPQGISGQLQRLKAIWEQQSGSRPSTDGRHPNERN